MLYIPLLACIPVMLDAAATVFVAANNVAINNADILFVFLFMPQIQTTYILFAEIFVETLCYK